MIRDKTAMMMMISRATKSYLRMRTLSALMLDFLLRYAEMARRRMRIRAAAQECAMAAAALFIKAICRHTHMPRLPC